MLPTILPKPAQQHGSGNPDEDRSAFKKKRSFVTLACAACRKRKTKCDGRRPICRPCEQRNQTCIFDFPDDVPAARRGKRKIEKLSKELTKANFDYNNVNNVIDALRSSTEEQAIAIVRGIRANNSWPHQANDLDHFSTEPIMDSLESPRIDPAYGPSTLDPVFDRDRLNHAELVQRMSSSPSVVGNPAVTSNRDDHSDWTIARNYPMARSHVFDISTNILPVSKWTSVPGSDKQFSQLLMLLWTWDTTFTRVIDRRAFEKDLQSSISNDAQDSVGRQFCSGFLVNALLGFACVHITDDSIFGRVEDAHSTGRLFVEQAEGQVERKMARLSLDLLQGLILLHAYEARMAHTDRAREYLDKAFSVYEYFRFDVEEVRAEEDHLVDHDGEQAFHAKSKILWSVYMFDWKPSYTYGQRKRLSKPSIAKAWQTASSEPDNVDDWWFAWPPSLPKRRSYYKEVFDAECSLIEIAEDILIFAYPNETDSAESLGTQQQALQLCNRLERWKLAFSDVVPEGANELPQSLHVSYCYEMLLILVLRKVAHLSKEDFGTSTDPQALCYTHANNITSILWAFRALYPIKHECWAVQACSLVAFSTIFTLDLDTVIYDSFEKICRILYDISEAYPIALDFLFTLRLVVHHRQIKVSKIASKYLSMADGPRLPQLSAEWRALILLGKSQGTRVGQADITLGELMEGFRELDFSTNAED